MFKKVITIKDGRKIILREPRSSDLKEFMRNINKQVRDREADGIGRDRLVTLAEERKWLKKNLENIKKKKHVILAFEHDQKIIGSCGVKREEGMRRHMVTFGIAVEKEYRRQGIATKAVPILISFAKKRMKGIRIIKLDVFSYNKPAIAAYKKIGFKKVAALPDSVMKKGKLYDNHVMYYYLK